MPDLHPSIGGLRLVFGGNIFGWTVDKEQSFRLLDAFFAAGGRMIDTAEGYSAWVPGNRGGESETIIGEWQESRGVRSQVLIGTKTGMGGPPGALEPHAVTNALEASLNRLRTDYVDLFYAHRDDLVTPLDNVTTAFDTAFRAGKARELGASNYTAARLAEIIALAEQTGRQPFTVMQPEYNLVMREDYEGDLQQLCISKKIAVLPFYGLASGFLSGKYQSAKDWEGSSRSHALDKAAANDGWRIVRELKAVSNEYNVTPAQLALAWLNAQPGVAAPLASATSLEQLQELCTAAILSQDAVKELEQRIG